MTILVSIMHFYEYLLDMAEHQHIRIVHSVLFTEIRLEEDRESVDTAEGLAHTVCFSTCALIGK